MAVDIDDKLAQTRLPAGYTFARVTAIANRDTWAEIFARSYGLPLPVGAALPVGSMATHPALRRCSTSGF